MDPRHGADGSRAPVSPCPQDNPFLTMERAVSAQITSALDQYRDARDAWYELAFETLYQSPLMAALVGHASPQAPVNLESPVTVQLRKELAQRRLSDAQAAIEQGGMREAFVRILAYVADSSAWRSRSVRSTCCAGWRASSRKGADA
ncbi:DUF3141 domain-containing protein [Cupriavidus basilensis]